MTGNGLITHTTLRDANNGGLAQTDTLHSGWIHGSTHWNASYERREQRLTCYYVAGQLCIIHLTSYKSLPRQIVKSTPAFLLQYNRALYCKDVKTLYRFFFLTMKSVLVIAPRRPQFFMWAWVILQLANSPSLALWGHSLRTSFAKLFWFAVIARGR